jgi:phage FluMu protein gp41
MLEFDLKHGLTLGEGAEVKTRKHVTLRAPTAGDVIEAQEESEKLVYAADAAGNVQPTLVTSPALTGIHVLRRQLVKLDDIHGPLDLSLLKKLHIEDFELIQAKAQELDAASSQAARTASREVTQRGRNDGDGGGP